MRLLNGSVFSSVWLPESHGRLRLRDRCPYKEEVESEGLALNNGKNNVGLEPEPSPGCPEKHRLGDVSHCRLQSYLPWDSSFSVHFPCCGPALLCNFPR